MVNEEKYRELVKKFDALKVTLVAVSKLKGVEDIQQLYDMGQRDFAENYVQELMDKQAILPADIRWHFIGHLQTNKVKYIASFVHLIQSADSEKLLKEINKQAEKHQRKINCLLQVHIADEQTKFGFSEGELHNVPIDEYNNLAVCGLMGMASFSDDKEKVRSEFNTLRVLFESTKLKSSGLNPEPYTFDILSMGMSDDYETAISCGSNMVRLGSLIFGRR
ncbi:MAG: YggS family pyridoxal phosphate-dependent enzyme [Ferruginibacter sp.]